MSPRALLHALALLAALAPGAYPFAGRVPPPKDVVRIWAEDRMDRTLAVYALVNETPGVHDWLRRDIPRTLALALPNPVELQFPPVPVTPQLRGLEAYSPLSFTVGATNFQRPPGNKSTNLLYFSDLLTNQYLAYVITNATNRNLLTALRFRSNTIYIDPMLSNWNAGNLQNSAQSNQFVWTNHGEATLAPRVLFQETNGWRRTLRLIDSLYESGSVSVGDLFARVNADYHLTGTLADQGENRVRLRLVLLDRNRRCAQSLFDRVLSPERWVEETSTVAPLLLAMLQSRAMVTNVLFRSKPEGAYVYLDGRYAGSTPFTLQAWPAGPVRLRAWHQGASWDRGATAADAGRRFVSNLGEELQMDFAPGDSGATNTLLLLPPQRTGTLALSVGGNPRADIWVDGELVASGTNAFESNVEPGSHAIAVRASRPRRSADAALTLHPTNALPGTLSNAAAPSGGSNQTFSKAPPPSSHASVAAQRELPGARARPGAKDLGFQDRIFQLVVRQDTRLDLALRLKPPRRVSAFERIFLDADRNTLVFGTLGLVGAAASVYTLLRMNEHDDLRYQAYSRGFYSVYGTEQAAYEAWRDAFTGCAVATGASLLFTLGFRIAAISQHSLRIETEYNHGPDVRFTWKTEF